MNKFVKYCPNVFVASCEHEQEEGADITLTTKYMKEIECKTVNFLGNSKDGRFLYSILRLDGNDYKNFCKRKAERLSEWAASASNKSDEYYEAAKEGHDFLVLAEPIKIGHHSERRHRALFERNDRRMRACIEHGKKAKMHERKSNYWESKSKEINLSMPESIDYFAEKLAAAKEYQEGLKSGKYQREHAYSLTYATKSVKELTDKLETAIKLWG